MVVVYASAASIGARLLSGMGRSFNLTEEFPFLVTKMSPYYGR